MIHPVEALTLALPHSSVGRAVMKLAQGSRVQIPAEPCVFFSLYLDRLCHLSIAHHTTGCVARDKIGKTS